MKQKEFNKISKVINEFLDIHERQDKLIYLRDIKKLVEYEINIILPIGLTEKEKEEFNFKEVKNDRTKFNKHKEQ